VISSLRRLWVLRSRLLEGVIQDVRQKYVGSFLGALWVIIFPALQLGIYTFVYTVIFRIRPAGLDELTYVVLVFSGLVPLLAFSEAVQGAASSLTANRAILLNAVFPAELIPLRAALAAHAPSLFGLLLTTVAAILLGRGSWVMFLVPVAWTLIIMFAVGIGWILSLLSLVARDIQQSLGLIIMLLFMLSPFAYTPDMIPGSLKILIFFNPLSYFVLFFQSIVCYGLIPDLGIIVGTVLWSVGSFLIGLYLFQRAKHVFFDYA
jgi:lipopolysaccharide transport system permease protein